MKKYTEHENTNWENLLTEYMKVSTGELVGTYLCDSCNAPLEPGQTGFLVQSFLTESASMDIGQENTFFRSPSTRLYAAYPILPLVPVTPGTALGMEPSTEFRQNLHRLIDPERLDEIISGQEEDANALSLEEPGDLLLTIRAAHRFSTALRAIRDSYLNSPDKSLDRAIYIDRILNG